MLTNCSIFTAYLQAWLHLHGVPSICEPDNKAQHKALIEGYAEFDSDEYKAGELGGFEKNMLLYSAPILLSSLLLIFRSFKETASRPFLASVFLLPPLFPFEWAPSSKLSAHACAISVSIMIFLSYPLKCKSFLSLCKLLRKAVQHCPRSS